jgi:hypothetical protein
VDDVGGVLAKVPHEAQIELFDLLVDGCQEAVKENTDIKVITLLFVNSKDYFVTSSLLSSLVHFQYRAQFWIFSA